MIIHRLFTLLLTIILACSASKISAQEGVIEHQGNKYIIHVERLNPDSEMTLLDVLHICPEFFSTDGKGLIGDYLLSVDDIMLSGDYEPLLEGIKAVDLSEVVVCTYGAVNNAMDGITGSIDLQFKEGSKGMAGKLGINGSTYGNGRLYADMTSTSENVTIHGIAQTSLLYGKANANNSNLVTTRGLTEDAMVFINWNMSERDVMKLKFFQAFNDEKGRVYSNDGDTYIWPDLSRYGEFSAAYERTLSDNGAALYLEADVNYSNINSELVKIRNTTTWWITEFSFPIFTKDLWMTAGWEIDYANLWRRESNREQYLNNDFYVMLDYTHGPWVLSIGDRLRINNFWDKRDVSDPSLWSYNRTDHAFHASIGYQNKRHFVQGTLSRTYYNPTLLDFYYIIEESQEEQYQTDFKTNLAWRAEARYNYQTKNMVLTSSLQHLRLTDMILPNEYLTGLKTSVTWNKGPLRLTVGANFYHRHISARDDIKATYNNFYNLKLAPTWLIGKGFRLSSVLLYNSRKIYYLEEHPYLYASIKINKDLGKRCNIYADYHDIAGQPTATAYELIQSYKNRALTIGLTFYPFR